MTDRDRADEAQGPQKARGGKGRDGPQGARRRERGSGGEGGARARRGDDLWEGGARELSRLGLLRELPPAGFFPAGARGEDGPRQGDRISAEGRRLRDAKPGADARESGGLVLCSNDYLALSCDPRVKAAAVAATEDAGCGSSGSRLLSGNSRYHVELEEELAGFTGYDACLLFGSGYHANAGAIPAMAERLEVILSDELNHASIIDGCRLARARTITYRHCDPADLDRLLGELAGGPVGSAGERPRALVITEGVFSMDGDVAPLEDLVAVAARRGAVLMVDDAHGFGVLGATGRGTPQDRGVAEGVDVYLGTLGKALGAMGGFIAGSRALINYLTSTARSLLYSTALAPAACAAATAALRIVRSESERRERLRRLSSLLREELGRAGLDTGRSESHIVPVMAPGERAALDLARRLEARGYFTRAIRYPTVARGSERLRLSLRADFTEEEMRGLAAALKEEGEALGLVRR